MLGSDVVEAALSEDAAEEALGARVVEERQAVRGERHGGGAVKGGHHAVDDGEVALDEHCAVQGTGGACAAREHVCTVAV